MKMKKQNQEHTRLIDMWLDRMHCPTIDDYKPVPYAIGTVVQITNPAYRIDNDDAFAVVQEVNEFYKYQLVVIKQENIEEVAWFDKSELTFVEDANPKSIAILDSFKHYG